MTSTARDEEGFTLVELLVTTMLVGLVTIVLFTTSDSFARISATTQNRSESLADARTALERIARDLRAANPVDEIADPALVPQYDNSISFSVYCKTGTPGCNAVTNLRPVTYAVANGVLTQTTPSGTATLVKPVGTPSLPTNLRKGALVNPPSEPVFTYFRRDGSRIVATDGSASGAHFRDCTKTVKIHLMVRSEPNKSSQLTDLVTTVNLRNYNEVNPC